MENIIAIIFLFFLFKLYKKIFNKIKIFLKENLEKKSAREKTIEENKGDMFTERPVHIYKKKYFFTKNENLFFRTLQEALKEENVIILSKVRIIDIISIPERQKNFIYYFNKLKAKHIDFVVCDKDYFSPIYCIELDDKSHLREDRIQRDILVNEIFKKVEMPLIRIKAKESYEVNEIKESLNITTERTELY
ncbi:DUF2726 domain-containing protein [Alkaliphilus oremlandii]|uniref:DUF2726 domain-containing protein n=1 Tax=Alkaliphilus oremlandii (strain OhILAs) TaxID=350688 RepID=A8MHS8_ALKOO|nr:DUF2726 domain-containing protein [Alkaliphilus oremlandii]ABW19360.1 hypothetical protein Clos_1820 [Alkaliphilus oremlandii OhILAs]